MEGIDWAAALTALAHLGGAAVSWAGSNAELISTVGGVVVLRRRLVHLEQVMRGLPCAPKVQEPPPAAPEPQHNAAPCPAHAVA